MSPSLDASSGGSSAQHPLARRVGKARSIDERHGGEGMELNLTVRADVTHCPAPNHQGVGYEPTVTTPPEGLGAHERGRPLGRNRHDVLEGPRELGSSHVIGICPEGRVSPPCVWRSVPRPAPSAEVRHVCVDDALPLEGLLQSVGGEVGKTARSGNPSDVDQTADIVAAQQHQKSAELMRGMADREDRLRALSTRARDRKRP